MSQSRTKRLTAIHGWSGTVLGILLYVVIVTGAIVVFDNEIRDWSQGSAQVENGLSGKVDRIVRNAARGIDPKFYEEVFVRPHVEGQMRVSFQSHQTNPDTGGLDDYVILLTLDKETGEEVSRKEGFSGEVFGADRGAALSRFLVDLHVQLYLPEPWGLYMTGILGLLMMAASVTGFLMHKHLFRDAFLPARPGERLVTARDRHILAASWSLPFAIILAFTGAFFSFALSLAVPVLAMVAFGGDQQALVETVLGVPDELDLTRTSLASLDYIIADATSRVGGAPTLLQIDHYGSASAMVTSFHSPAPSDLTRQTLLFDGVTREYLGVKPTIGLAPSVGSSLVSLMGPLHFGNFAGLLSKTVWLALGLAMAYVTATGMLLWTKRREEERLWQNFNRALTITIWGLPIAVLGSAYGFFFFLPAGDTVFWTPVAFAIATIVCIWVGFGKKDPTERYIRWLGYMSVLLPLFRHIVGGLSWSEALIQGQMAVLTIDILLVIGGLVLLRPLRHAAPLIRRRHLEPAE
ncbi:MAG: PepSY-associated TM helix domain-containing protein [Pseudomonadota bacterium]